MSISLEAQGQAFLLTLGMGALLGLSYDLLRLLRLLLPPRWAQELLDLLFWLGAFGLLFFCAAWLEGGRVRLYLALALLSGSLAYFLLLSPAVRRLLSRLTALVAHFLGLLLSPLHRLCAVLTAQWAKIIRPCRETWKKFFSFFQRWSKMNQFQCLHRRISRRKKEVSPHAAQQKGWSDSSAPSPGPSDLHGLHAGPGPGPDHHSLQRLGPTHRPGHPAASNKHRIIQRHRKPR